MDSEAENGIEEPIVALRELLEKAKPRTTFGFAGPTEVRRISAALEYAITQAARCLPLKGPQMSESLTIEAYSSHIDRFNASQPNAPLLDAIRAYNHSIVDAVDEMQAVKGLHVLDIGASPHGYALEHSLSLGARRYVGVGLDVDLPVFVHSSSGSGELQKQNAEALLFEDQSFDLIFSMSTFEHVAHVDRVLCEMHRVLKLRGKALVTFEPIWTCSYGHHLHHFGEVSKLMPDWAHLVWSKQEMLHELRNIWPNDSPITLNQAAEWVYDGPALNRIGIAQMRELFQRGPFKIEWITPLMDSQRDDVRLSEIANRLVMTPDDLMTKGLSVFLRRA